MVGIGEFTAHFRLPIVVVGLGWGLTGVLTHLTHGHLVSTSTPPVGGIPIAGHRAPCGRARGAFFGPRGGFYPPHTQKKGPHGVFGILECKIHALDIDRVEKNLYIYAHPFSDTP